MHKHRRGECLSRRKACECHQCSLAKKKKIVENYESGVLRNLRGALAFAVESQDEITAAAVALGVLELDESAVVSPHGRLELRRRYVCRSRSRLRESAQDAQMWDPYTAGRAPPR